MHSAAKYCVRSELRYNHAEQLSCGGGRQDQWRGRPAEAWAGDEVEADAAGDAACGDEVMSRPADLMPRSVGSRLRRWSQEVPASKDWLPIALRAAGKCRRQPAAGKPTDPIPDPHHAPFDYP